MIEEASVDCPLAPAIVRSGSLQKTRARASTRGACVSVVWFVSVDPRVAVHFLAVDSLSFFQCHSQTRSKDDPHEGHDLRPAGRSYVSEDESHFRTS